MSESFEVRGGLIVLMAILWVGFLVGAAMWAISASTGENVDAIVSALTAGTGVIGTLVGSFLGLRLGTEGRGQAQEQAEQYRQQSDLMLRALAVLPPEQAQAVLRQVDEGSAPSAGAPGKQAGTP